MVSTIIEMKDGASFLKVTEDQLAFPRKFTALCGVVLDEINRCPRSINFGSPLCAEAEEVSLSISSFSGSGILSLLAIPSLIQPVNSDPSGDNNAGAQEKTGKIKLHKIWPFLIVYFLLDAGVYQHGFLVGRFRERQSRFSLQLRLPPES